MSLQLRNICSIKLKGVPLINNIFNNIPIWKEILKQHTTFEKKNDDELNILCIQNLYSYNSGFIGSIINNLGFLLPSTKIFKYLLNNYDCNDIELLCFIFNIISRFIPINNIYTDDFKNNLSDTLPFINKNLSIPSLYNLNSLFCFKPIFDCGCAIFSNKKADETGFVSWKNNNNSYYNKGMTWCLFKNNKEGIVIINLDCIENDISCFKELVELKICLEERYGKVLDSYETYITGNFNEFLNMNETLPEAKEAFNILKNANIEIVNNKYLSSNEFILYSRLKNNIEYEFIDMSVEDSDYILYKFNIKSPNMNFTFNPVYNIETSNEEISKKKDNSPKNEISLNPISFLQSIKDSYFDTRSDTSEKSSESWEQV